MNTKQPDNEFIEMIKEHSSILYKICHGYCSAEEDRNDLLQEMILQLWKAYPSYKREAKEGTWIYRVALNTAISEVRRSSRKPKTEYISDFSIDQRTSEPQEKTDDLDLLYKAIMKLNNIEKAIIMLYLEEKSYREIGSITGLSEKNVSVKIVRIKKKLRKMMESKANG